jgi:hypothetical protein
MNDHGQEENAMTRKNLARNVLFEAALYHPKSIPAAVIDEFPPVCNRLGLLKSVIAVLKDVCRPNMKLKCYADHASRK